VAMQFYASPEQIMRDRSEFARKNIARGRNVVILSYDGGVLFVAENQSSTLHKISEIYDRIGFAAVGRYNEFENLRAAGVRLADLRGYSYDRRDVTGRALATAFAQTLGSIFTDQQKPFEVEICVAEVGAEPEQDEMYQLTFDGSVQEGDGGVIVMGGQAEPIGTKIKGRHVATMTLGAALRLATEALASVGGGNSQPRTLTAAQLEVAVLDRHRPGRTFRRITGAALTALLAPPDADAEPAPATGDAAPATPADATHDTPAGATPDTPAGATPDATEDTPVDATPDATPDTPAAPEPPADGA